MTTPKIDALTEALNYITDDQSSSFQTAGAWQELDALLSSHRDLYAALEGLLLNAPQPDKNIRKSFRYRISIEAARAALTKARGMKGGA